MGKELFKGFKQINGLSDDFNIESLEEGYVYLVRTDNAKKDGYFYFNGKVYGSASGKVSAINLFEYQSEDTPINADGDFSVYLKDEESGDIYLSSHHRYLIYDNSMVRFDCLVHSMVTEDMNRGYLYSMMMRNEDGTWSLQGYVLDDTGVLNPDLSNKEYETEEEANADKARSLSVIRAAFDEPYVTRINLANYTTESQEFELNSNYLITFETDEVYYQSLASYKNRNFSFEVLEWQYDSENNYDCTPAVIAMLTRGDSGKWHIYGYLDMINNKELGPDFTTEASDIYFQGDSDVAKKVITPWKFGSSTEGSAIDDSAISTLSVWSSSKTNEELGKKQNTLTAGTDIKIEDDVISVEEDWSVAIFDTAEFNKGSLSIATPDGYVFDKLYILCHWYGPSSVATSIYGGFYQGANTDASKQVLRNNGTNKMGAGYITANVVNIDDTTAIAYGEGYFYNNTGSATTLNNPINSYGIGRYSHVNDFTHFTIHNYPSGITEGYCCIKYKLKKL